MNFDCIGCYEFIFVKLIAVFCIQYSIKVVKFDNKKVEYQYVFGKLLEIEIYKVVV